MEGGNSDVQGRGAGVYERPRRLVVSLTTEDSGWEASPRASMHTRERNLGGCVSVACRLHVGCKWRGGELARASGRERERERKREQERVRASERERERARARERERESESERASERERERDEKRFQTELYPPPPLHFLPSLLPALACTLPLPLPLRPTRSTRPL
eukprot:1152202-Rhodomonas_salina.1